MVRKSERNKSKPEKAGTPEKSVEKKKAGRPPKRRKKSESGSEAEDTTELKKEVGDQSESGSSRRSSRRPPNPTLETAETPPLPPPPQQEAEKPEKNSEWKEDPGFWGSEDSTPAPAAAGQTVEEATTWKIQSSNGSGGVIQKLKICRQRIPNDSNDSSSPAHVKDSSSPRKKKKSKHADESAESSGDVSSSNEAREEIKKLDPREEIQKLDPREEIQKLDPHEEIQKLDPHEEIQKLKDPPPEVESRAPPETPALAQAEEPPQEEVSSKTEDMIVQPSDFDEPEPDESEKLLQAAVNSIVEQPEEIPMPQDFIPMPDENVTREETVQEEAIPAQQEDLKVTEEVEVETCSRRSSQEESKESAEEPKEPSVERDENLAHPEQVPIEEVKSASRKSSVEEDTLPSVNKETPDAETPPEKTPIKVKEASPTPTAEEPKKEVPRERLRTKSEASDDGKGEKKLLSKVKVAVAVTREDAMDEIAKKLNERAARFSRDEERNKEKGREARASTDSAEPSSPREEGELTPTPDAKRKHTTIIINRPKEITSKPTRLKRNTDEIPPTERKRRILLKSKPKEKEQDPINISSQSLMLLVPEVKTITPEQVASFPLDDVELTRFEMDEEGGEEPQEEEESPKTSRKHLDLRPKEMEIRVENDTRQVSKKRPIVFDTKENERPGPKLPSQENHRVVRKISIVTEETRKPRRSPSPASKNETEVLFISNLVRPFTVPQLKELLARTGTIAPNGFYIDKIKSKCYVKYTDVEMAVETRHALNGVRWPVNNPKTLRVEFVQPEDMEAVQRVAEDEPPVKKVDASDPAGAIGWLSEQAALKPQRRVTTAVREWDMGKVGAGPLEEKRPPVDDWKANAKPELPEQKRRPQSPVDPKYEPPARKTKKRDIDAPARLLDDLFRKTKATPCIYWLPLTAAQIAVKEEMRRQHMAEHERRLAELRKSDHPRPERARDRDRDKSRDRRKK